MKELVCIVCPNGCTMQLEGEGDNLQVTGNKCKRGLQFAKEELTEPKRTICSTVRTVFADCPVLPVRVSADIPKEKIFDIMDKINAVCVTERVHRGDIIIKNVCKTGADIIATGDLQE